MEVLAFAAKVRHGTDMRAFPARIAQMVYAVHDIQERASVQTWSTKE